MPARFQHETPRTRIAAGRARRLHAGRPAWSRRVPRDQRVRPGPRDCREGRGRRAARGVRACRVYRVRPALAWIAPRSTATARSMNLLAVLPRRDLRRGSRRAHRRQLRPGGQARHLRPLLERSSVLGRSAHRAARHVVLRLVRLGRGGQPAGGEGVDLLREAVGIEHWRQVGAVPSSDPAKRGRTPEVKPLVPSATSPEEEAGRLA